MRFNKYEYQNTSYRSKVIKGLKLKERLVVELGLVFVLWVTIYLIV